LHDGSPPPTAGQTLPQAPQFFGSDVSSTHAAPQRVPFGHEKSHCPLVQVALPPGGAVQLAPHPPQFSTSFASSTHLPRQIVCPSLHATDPPPSGSVSGPASLFVRELGRTQTSWAQTKPGRHEPLSQGRPSPFGSRSLEHAASSKEMNTSRNKCRSIQKIS
jgi:hypothetical protein